MNGIQHQLAHWRKACGWTQEQLADACTDESGITKWVIANVESGRQESVTVAQLVELCRVLQVSVVALVPELRPYMPANEFQLEDE